jgi:dynein assembly factor with WDR repeat domains 1
MKLKRFLLRYYPPGIILEYIRSNGESETKSIDLLNLSAEYNFISPILPQRTNVDQLVNEIVLEEPIISESKKPQLKSLIKSISLHSFPENQN